MEKSNNKTRDSYFDGSILKYYGVNILSFLITLFSLGICASWGQCLVYSYKINHTVYNGRRLKFEGSGWVLFLHRMKSILLTIITFGVYAIILPVKRARWVMSNTHFEDDKLGSSSFDGEVIHYVGINLLYTVLSISSFGLLIPFIQCYKLRWINKHTVINNKKIAFDGKSIELFGRQMLWGILAIITLGIYTFWIPVNVLKWQTKHTSIKSSEDVEVKDSSIYWAILILIIGVLLFNFVVPRIVTVINNTGIIEKLNIN